jgi:hypothetical protein
VNHGSNKKHPRHDTHPDDVEVVRRTGTYAGRSTLIPAELGPELGVVLVVNPEGLDSDVPDVVCALAFDAYEAGRLVGILQVQAELRNCAAALGAGVDQGREWARRELVGGAT